MGAIETLLDEPLIQGQKSLSQVSGEIGAAAERRPTWLWWTAFLTALSAFAVGAAAVAYLFVKGVGTWGVNATVGWAFAITNFVFWIGIGHAGTLISAILFLFRQRWRTSVNRAAEAMTLFAVVCAGLFPILHLGRPWLFFWLIPYPNTRGSLWVNFRSPLVWDFFAISTYLTISLIFWYLGLVPDLATLRDRCQRPVRRWFYRFFSLGWDGSYRTWMRYETVYLLLAGLATPLVVSVHTIVSWDFATSIIPGWHSTIFPPYFVAGAIFSGLGMVLTLVIIVRKVMRLQDYITLRHIEAMCKLIIVTGGIVAVSYGIELFMAFYSGSPYEEAAFLNRMTGPLAWGYGIMVACNIVVPQLLWIRKLRTNLAAVFAISILINVGMWFERFVIVVTSLERDYLPSSWANFSPTRFDVATLVGSFGLFFTLFLLFCRFVPVISIADVKSVLSHGRARREVNS